MKEAITEGFILSRKQWEKQNQTFLEYWLSTADGAVRVCSPAEKFVLFVSSDSLQSEKAHLQHQHPGSEVRELPLKLFNQQLCSAIYSQTQAEHFALKDWLKSRDIVSYEDDIRLSDRFLMERFIYGSATVVSGESTPHGLYHCRLKSSDYTPEFSPMSLDIECSEKGELYSIGMASAERNLVLMVGEPQQDAPEWILWVKDEIELLQRFVAHFNAWDPDIIIGWSVISFDFRLLLKRAQRHNLSLTIGRDGSAMSWRDAKTGSQAGFLNLAGRVVLDGIDSLKSATYQFDSFSLEFVAQELLGKGKKVEDVSNRMAHINHDFKHNKIKLAEYNLQDCILVLEIFEKTKLMQFLVLRSQLTGLELDRAGGSVAAFTNLYLPKLHRAGYIAPNLPKDGGLASPGGYVMNSRPGLYRHVLVLDFKSLYPSIIRTFKIDPLGLIEALQSPGDAIPGFKGAMFSREKHFLPDIITQLWQQRDVAKRQQDSARSQAIKILMNSFYGVLGSGGCRFYDTRLASSITLRGHDIMQTTAKWIEEQGHCVIYGDTDSTFVWLQDCADDTQAQDTGEQLANMINQRWQEKLQAEYHLECYLELEFETHFSQFLMPTIRGSELGSKKRYAGLKKTAKGEELVFKGLETVRSDWTLLAKDFQIQLYQMVFAGEDVSEYINEIVNKTELGQFDDKLVYRKRLRQGADKYVKTVPPHVKAARIADDHLQAQGKKRKYQKKGWIKYVQTINGPEPLEFLRSPIDYHHYVEKQLKPIAEGILPFVGQNFESISSKQMGLF
ncbi:DNA polymerase II [Planctobacterium marinum]|uniref:DNA polymerase n=1 Tax=Planctobacterium marinum TaxID=1631968 RepID=A0AA48HMS5_9ALTE|nr:DNA polymerase [Planctobacterium marinum]